jgi:hypothetical protein
MRIAILERSLNQQSPNKYSHGDGFFRYGFAFTTKPRVLRALYVCLSLEGK